MTKRRFKVEGCAACDAELGDYYPPHDASAMCESGKRDHCTCDYCW